MNAESPWLTSDEAALYLKLSPRTLANWRHVGRGPRYVKRGDLVRYRIEDLDAHLLGTDQPAQATA